VTLGLTEHLPNSKIIRTTPEAQGESPWTPPGGTLGELVESAWKRSSIVDSHDRFASRTAQPKSLAQALRGDFVKVIAEVKRSSPSKGVINASIDAGKQAAQYEAGGAAAISVLTEPDRFGGSNADIARVREACSLPILKKDFHVSESQIEEAAMLGASAALIIVRAVEPARLTALAAAAKNSGIEILYEVRDEAELVRALNVGATMIGVNNRDLETLRIDPQTVERIVPLIPRDVVAIAESGYSRRDQVESAAAAGADAVLVGSSLSGSDDPARAVAGIADVPRGSSRT
jgi:indole-3-glycerol phosphate synthase